MIVVVNASGTPAFKYEPWFKRLASWGFIVVGNEDPQAGTGETTSIMLDYLLNLPQDHKLNGRLDTDNIGIVGFSQGGAGALAAVTMYDNGTVYKTIFTGSAAYPFLAGNMGWKYDVSKIKIPYFMVAGTGATDDKGVNDMTKEYAGVAPLASLVENYEAISDDVLKVRARATGAEHEDMLARSDGYMTAWMLWQLCGDEDAAEVFVGEKRQRSFITTIGRMWRRTNEQNSREKETSCIDRPCDPTGRSGDRRFDPFDTHADHRRYDPKAVFQYGEHQKLL